MGLLRRVKEELELDRRAADAAVDAIALTNSSDSYITSKKPFLRDNCVALSQELVSTPCHPTQKFRLFNISPIL